MNNVKPAFSRNMIAKAVEVALQENCVYGCKNKSHMNRNLCLAYLPCPGERGRRILQTLQDHVQGRHEIGSGRSAFER